MLGKITKAAADSTKVIADSTKAISDSATETAKAQVVSSIESVFGKGTSDAIVAVCNIFGSLYADLFPDSKYPMIVNAAMIMRQVSAESRYKTPLVSGVSYCDQEVFKKAARYAIFADASYKKTKAEVAAKIPELLVDHIYHLESSEAVKRPNFFIAEDVITDTLVLAIRGTATVADAFTDCLCEEVPFLSGHAHGAIAENAQNVIEIAKPILVKLLEKSPDKKVVVTGHSLGAGTAVLTSLKLFSKESKDSIHDADLVDCFAFAPPSVFHPREKLPSSPQIYSFINNMDCIPRCCLGTGVKFLLAIREVDQLEVSLVERLKLLASKSFPSEPKMPDYKDIPEDLQAKYRSHHPAGNLILLYPNADNGLLCCEELEPEMTDRLLFHSSMASDHSMNNYCKLLTDIVVVNSIDSRKTKASAGRLPVQLERLPANQLQDVLDALAVLEKAGLTEVPSIPDMRERLENSKQIQKATAIKDKETQD